MNWILCHDHHHKAAGSLFHLIHEAKTELVQTNHQFISDDRLGVEVSIEVFEVIESWGQRARTEVAQIYDLETG